MPRCPSNAQFRPFCSGVADTFFDDPLQTDQRAVGRLGKPLQPETGSFPAAPYSS